MRRRRWLLALLLSVVLYGLSFPPWSFSWAAWFALVPLLGVLRSLQPRSAFGVGLLWAHAAHWAVAYWVPAALNDYYDQSWWFGLGFALLTSPVFWMVPFGVFGALSCWLMQRCYGWQRIILIALLWVGCELVRARLIGAPWMLLGYALLPSPSLIQIADLGGPYIISFVIVFANASMAEGLSARPLPHVRLSIKPSYSSSASASASKFRWHAWCYEAISNLQLLEAEADDEAEDDFGLTRKADFPREWGILMNLAPAVALIAATYLYGAHQLRQPFAAAGTIPISVVQGNNVSAARWEPGAYGQGFESYLRLSARAIEEHHPKLLVWPEAAVTLFLAHEPGYRRAIANLLHDHDVELITGAPHYLGSDPATPSYLNSAFYIRSDGELGGRVDKVHLLPFAEYFPLDSIEYLRRRFERVRTFTPASESPLLNTRLGESAVAICFEAIFPELVRERMARGAALLINLSNDVWLGGGAGPQQMLAMTTLRAVENRTWMIRATTTGISAIIDPAGRIITRSDTGVAALLHGAIATLNLPTIYKSYGDYFAFGCAAAACLGMIALRLSSPSRKYL